MPLQLSKQKISPYTVAYALLAFIVAICTGILLYTHSRVDTVYAANATNFNHTKIISDFVFTNNSSMSAGDIQSFLDQKNSVCLRNYTGLALIDANNNGQVEDWTQSERYGGASGTQQMSAAQLIKAASDIYGINPQVLIVTLQKEQGLITRSDCPQWRYNTAFGFGCPDTAPCDQSAYGFTRQLDNAAYHFKNYMTGRDAMGNTVYATYKTGTYNILWSPTTSCGSSRFTIENKPTASLYTYTPYRPNQAALNAGYGTGDNCSAYGNRNFYLYFNDWFGSTDGYTIDARILTKYEQTNNLGSTSMSTVCGIKDGGCYHHFSNGSVYWSQNTGAQRIGGGIKSYWNKQGAEWSKLGYPVSDETYFTGGAKQEFQGGIVFWLGSDSTISVIYDVVNPTMNMVCGIRDNGCYQHFSNGSIYWSQKSGAQRIGGGIKSYWDGQGSEWGKLGYPTSGELYHNGGARQTFQGGVVYWDNASGAAKEFNNLGTPSMSVACGIKNNGCYQHFSNASVYWSTASGMWRIGGGIKNHWNKQGSEWGKLGYPTSGETYFTGGAKQEFQGGVVLWIAATNQTVEITNANILARYEQSDNLGGSSTSTECAIRDNGCYQHFSNGSIYWSQKSGAQRIGGGIKSYWDGQGSEWGKLGYPTSGETYFTGGAKQEFQGGTLTWTEASNTVAATYR
ncbi:hypothetical protein KI440_00270 [Candidatus Saccharibacteria bacterium TM7i]|nr:hypothetical protein KI440_00270 [Candidatus Saccharibacteria bacterium TM7i]